MQRNLYGPFGVRLRRCSETFRGRGIRGELNVDQDEVKVIVTLMAYKMCTARSALWLPQQNPSKVPRMETAGRGLPRKDDGGNEMTFLPRSQQ